MIMNGLTENFNAEFNDGNDFVATFADDSAGLVADFGETQIIETSDYNNLINKPSINEVELKGNKTLEDLGDKSLTNIEIKHIFDKVFKGGQ